MHDQNDDNSPTVISTRTMEIVVAVCLLVVSAIVIKDSLRLGIGWGDVEGPRSGYFPFYVGLMLAIASLVTLVQMILAGLQERRANLADAGGRREAPAAARAENEPFVSAQALRRVLLVLLPMLVYIFVVSFVGIYIASAIYITLFMMYFGEYRLPAAALTAIIATAALFMMFEVWFLVPLPKGPIEEMFGF
jgi:putative tricarboxylic transport membrane protein